MSPKDHIILALDTDSRDLALRWVDLLGPHVSQFKIGLELVNNVGFDIFDDLRGWRLFYDAKFHDIPNTVAGAVRGATRAGVWMVNMHVSGGSAMMEAARQAAEDIARVEESVEPYLLGVTVLSSLNTRALHEELGMSVTAEDQALRLARLAQDAGLDGVVAGGEEVSAIREACGPDFIIMTPGIRPAGSELRDQVRVLTPGEAVHRGSTFIGVGRPVTRSQDPVGSLQRILDEVASAM